MTAESSLKMRAQDLVVGYNDGKLVKPFSFHLKAGETLTVIGKSGVGKTCLLRTITGQMSAVDGKITFIGDTKPSIAILDQEFQLYTHLSVELNVELALRKAEPLWLRFLENNASRKWAHKLLQDVGLSDVARSKPNRLSGGQRQRAALAVALAVGAEVLILDEPFSGLDQTTRHELQDLLIELTEKRKLITIMVTHDLEEALYIGSRCLVLRPIEDGKPVVVEISSEKQDDSRRYHWMFLKQTQVLQQIMQGQIDTAKTQNKWTINEIELADLERAATEVWVFSRYMNQDAQNPYLKQVVQSNLSQQKAYTYFIPENNQAALANLKRICSKSEWVSQISARHLPDTDPVFSMGELVILNPKDKNARVGYSYIGDENGTLLYRMHDEFVDNVIKRH